MAVASAFLFGLAFTVVNPALADSFRCELQNVVRQSETGALDGEVIFPNLMETAIVVDRDTGKVFHPFFGNENYANREVLDYGSSHSSFKVISYSDLVSPPIEGEAGVRNFAMFIVHTHVDNQKKPFIAYDTLSTIGTGVCQ
ncbi:hypothetical protein [Aliiroseovarius marinus]|uniref:hypothetical protein n=1 Tax=Aliiroseovarius marinus TaxID=2500159 RepID=UPI003D7C791C